MMAVEYGKALFSLAEEGALEKAVLDEINTVDLILKKNPEYIGIQDSPAIPWEEKEGLLSEAFQNTDKTVRSLIFILAKARRLYLFADIVKEYTRLYNEAMGICKAEIITAAPLDESRVRRITERLEAITGMTVTPKCTVDESLIGGIKIRYLGKELDGSIRSRLKAMEKSLKGVIV
jgi:F-type H+-transporting ATPase subunit delta